MRRFSAVVVAAVLGVAAANAPVISALSWPLPPQSQLMYGPAVFQGTANTWCGVDLNGSYTSVFFTQAQAWVNYGGSCNAQWGRPANYLRARAKSYAGVTLTGDSGYVYNAYAATLAQANVSFHLGDDGYYWFNDFWLGASYRSYVGFRL